MSSNDLNEELTELKREIYNLRTENASLSATCNRLNQEKLELSRRVNQLELMLSERNMKLEQQDTQQQYTTKLRRRVSDFIEEAETFRSEVLSGRMPDSLLFGTTTSELRRLNMTTSPSSLARNPTSSMNALGSPRNLTNTTTAATAFTNAEPQSSAVDASSTSYLNFMKNSMNIKKAIQEVLELDDNDSDRSGDNSSDTEAKMLKRRRSIRRKSMIVNNGDHASNDASQEGNNKNDSDDEDSDDEEIEYEAYQHDTGLLKSFATQLRDFRMVMANSASIRSFSQPYGSDHQSNLRHAGRVYHDGLNIREITELSNELIKNVIDSAQQIYNQMTALATPIKQQRQPTRTDAADTTQPQPQNSLLDDERQQTQVGIYGTVMKLLFDFLIEVGQLRMTLNDLTCKFIEDIEQKNLQFIEAFNQPSPPQTPPPLPPSQRERKRSFLRK